MVLWEVNISCLEHGSAGVFLDTPDTRTHGRVREIVRFLVRFNLKNKPHPTSLGYHVSLAREFPSALTGYVNDTAVKFF